MYRNCAQITINIGYSFETAAIINWVVKHLHLYNDIFKKQNALISDLHQQSVLHGTLFDKYMYINMNF